MQGDKTMAGRRNSFDSSIVSSARSSVTSSVGKSETSYSSSGDDDDDDQHLRQPRTNIGAGDGGVYYLNNDDNVSINSEEEYDRRFTKDKFVEAIVFLPFNLVWKFLLVASIVATYAVTLYQVIFLDCKQPPQTHWMMGLRYTSYVLYLVDTVCAIIHLKARSVAVLRPYLPRNIWMIIIDAFTLIPFDLVVDIMSTLEYNMQVTLHSIRCIRIYRVFLYFHSLSRSVGLNPWFTVFVSFGTVVFLWLHTLACLWERLSSGHGGQWVTKSELIERIKPETPQSWYLVTFYFILVVMMTTGYGDILPYTENEFWVVMWGMLIGYALTAGLFTGALVDVFVQTYRRHSVFWNKLSLIELDLRACHGEKSSSLLSQVTNYYKTFWHHKRAIKSSTLLMTLPPQMVVEVQTDIYWKAINKSRTFRDLHVSHKRELAKRMRSECYMEGDVIVAEGEVKDKMMYVVRGVIQILTKEDSKSPLIALSSGTCLGETSLLFSYTSMVEVNAVTYCEMHFLDKQELVNIMRSHPQIGEEIKKTFYKNLNRSLEDIKVRQTEEIWYEKSGDAKRALAELKLALQKKDEEEQKEPPFTWMSEQELDQVLPAKENEPSAPTVVNTYKDVVLNQYRLSKTVQLESDDVCLHSHMPWVFNPDSNVLELWRWIICMVVVIAAFLLPYYIAFNHEPDLWTSVVFIILDTCYWFDIYIKLFTAFRVDGELVTAISEIISKNFVEGKFIIDIFATLPLERITYSMGILSYEYLSTILHLNRLLKMYVVLDMFTELQNGPLWNNVFIRLLKYIVFLLLGSYWMGAIFYMQACMDGECNNSWLDTVKVSMRVLPSFYFAVQTISGTGYGDITAFNWQEIYFVLGFVLTGTMLYSLLISDYSAMLILTGMLKLDFKEKVIGIIRFLEVNQIQTDIQDRVNKFLSLQWLYRKGHMIDDNNRMYKDATQEMESSIKIWRRKNFFTSMDLFKECNPKLLAELCLQAESYILPPNEVISHAGEMCREFFVIEDGFCETSSNLWQEVGVIGPPTCVNESEMVFEVPSYHSLKTITHCRLLRVPRTNFKAILKMFPEEEEILSSLKVEYANHRGLGHVAHRKKSANSMGDTSYAVKRPSFIVHKASTKQHPNKDYDDPFTKLNMFSSFKYLLQKRTLHPSGKFLIGYEIVRCVFAYFACFLFPSSGVLKGPHPEILYAMYFLDCMAFIDLYVRMHVCYYNKDGLLVTHPWYTCKNYISHGFTLDLAACIPLSYMPSNTSGNEPAILVNLLQLNRCLQLHRISSLVSYWEEDILRSTKFYKLFKFVPVMLVVLNICSSLYETYNCWWQAADGVVRCHSYTWVENIGNNFRYNIHIPIYLHITVTYWASQTILNQGMGDITAQTSGEMAFMISVTLIGYVIFTYMTVLIATSNADYNKNLTKYQQHMKHLTAYMKSENVSKYLIRKVTEHFENVWCKTRGMKPHTMFAMFHIQLQEDVAMHLYEETLSGNVLFQGIERSFFRRLVVLLRELSFVKGAEVVTKYDLVSDMYIVHQGELNVYDLLGDKQHVLGRGHIFGNLEKQTRIRMTIPFEAATNVSLLVIPTVTFFKLAEEYPVIMGRLGGKCSEEVMRYNFHRHTKVLADSTTTTNSALEMSRFLLRFISVAYIVIMMCAYSSFMLIMYQLAFQDFHNWIIGVNYTLDAIVSMRIVLGFFVPYQNNLGDFVYRRSSIRKKYMKIILGFWFDLFVNFPWDVFCLVWQDEADRHYALSWLRTVHLLRIFNVVKFFNIRFERLHVNVLVYKLSSMLMSICLLIHVTACMLYMVACPRHTCGANTWGEVAKEVCDTREFMCALYFALELFSTAGFGNIRPFSINIVILTVVIIVVGRFIMAVFIGNMTAIVANYSLTLVNYNYETNTLKYHMKNNPICEPLVNKVLQYVKLMWDRERGHQLPTFLYEMPRYLKVRLNIEAYGKHLYENYVFSQCNGDFLRQLIVYMKRHTYFPGDYIVQQGDIDNTLYFIHVGEVEVIAVCESGTELVDLLIEGDSFGLKQGMHTNLPHDYTYRASAISVILSLTYDEWVHLIAYFPGAKGDILHHINSVLLPVVRI